MNYIKFSTRLRENRLYVFSLADVKNLFPQENEKTIKNNLTRWLLKSYCARLRRDLYEFTDEGSKMKIPDLYIANRLYEPSYVSLETALSFYSIIPDIAAGVTSVTSRLTRRFKNKYGLFLYKTCKVEAFTGYRVLDYNGFKIRIADKEKALVDFLYYRHRMGFLVDFEEERLNKKILNKINWEKALRYAKLFSGKTCETLNGCREYVKC